MQVTASEICRGVHVPSSSRDAHAHYTAVPWRRSTGQSCGEHLGPGRTRENRRTPPITTTKPKTSSHRMGRAASLWGRAGPRGEQSPPASRSSIMFAQLQKVDRGLQPSSVAAEILKQKWLAGLVPLEKTLASPPVILLPWVPTWRGKAGGKARRQDARKKARSFRASVGWGFIIKLKKDPKQN